MVMVVVVGRTAWDTVPKYERKNEALQSTSERGTEGQLEKNPQKREKSLGTVRGQRRQELGRVVGVEE